MKTMKLREAQKHLPDVVRRARREAIGLTDETGRLVGLVAGVGEDELDDFLVRTAAFRTMIARSKASLKTGAPVSARTLLEEARAGTGTHRK